MKKIEKTLTNYKISEIKRNIIPKLEINDKLSGFSAEPHWMPPPPPAHKPWAEQRSGRHSPSPLAAPATQFYHYHCQGCHRGHTKRNAIPKIHVVCLSLAASRRCARCEAPKLVRFANTRGRPFLFREKNIMSQNNIVETERNTPRAKLLYITSRKEPIFWSLLSHLVEQLNG